MGKRKNPSLSPPVICDKCKKEYFDFNYDGSKNFTYIYSDGNYDYCISCLPEKSNLNKFKKTSVYERIGKANLESGHIEDILSKFIKIPKYEKKEYDIPKEKKTDSEIYKLALRFYKDIYNLSNKEFDHFKQLILDSKLDCFLNNTISTFKLGPDKILKNEMISLNIVNAIVYCPQRCVEGRQNFKMSITRDGDIGAWETYGIYIDKLKPDAKIESLDCIDISNIKPDDLLD